MVSIATFARRTPLNLLLECINNSGITLPANGGQAEDTVSWISEFLRTVDQTLLSRFRRSCERIAFMSDEAGQSALVSVVSDTDTFGALPSGYARSCWAFLRENSAFHRAEEVRFTDEHRRGRMWSGVLTRSGLTLHTSEEAVNRFKQAIVGQLSSKNVHIDIFDRERASFDEKAFKIAQVNVFRDGLPEDHAEFIDGKLDWRSRIPVYEAALTYEPESGAVEVVAKSKDVRESLLRIFVEELLGDKSNREPLPLRKFDLAILSRPYRFPTDATDGIESVSVRMLRLQPFDAPHERITLECSSPEHDKIWKMVADHLGRKNPLLIGFVITQVKLVIKFRPAGASTRGKKLPVTVTMPHGCDLKGRTEQERLVGEKYLRKWKLLTDAK